LDNPLFTEVKWGLLYVHCPAGILVNVEFFNCYYQPYFKCSTKIIARIVLPDFFF